MAAAGSGGGSLMDALMQSEYAKSMQRDETPPYDQSKCAAIVTPLKRHQQTNVTFMLEREQDLYGKVVGGFLLDDLGLGKTLTVIALIAESLRSVNADHTTLIVVPANILFQWEQQLQTHLAAGTLRHALYYGRERQAAMATQNNADRNKYHVLITTYTTMSAEYDKRAKQFRHGSLFRQTFDRVVLDEAHTIRNRKSRMSQAACELSAERRWCVTATPLWNTIEDYYPLFSFMRLYPLAEWMHYRKNVVDALSRHPRDVFDLICENLQLYAVRHSKEQIAELAAIRKHQVRVSITLNEDERRFTDALVQRARLQIDTLLATHTWLRTYSKREDVSDLIGRIRFRVLALITRLRQAADSPELVLRAILPAMMRQADGDAEGSEMGELIAGALKRLELQVSEDQRQGGSSAECAVCLDAEPSHALLPCLHRTCYTCFSTLWARGINMHCPFCRVAVTGCRAVAHGQKRKLGDDSAGAASSADVENEEDDKDVAVVVVRQKQQRQKHGPPGSKATWLLELLRDGMKTVVFTQFLGYMDILQHYMEAAGIRVLRIEGKVKAVERLRLQSVFTTDASVQVMLCTLGAGGQGLNFQVAPRAVLMDPWYNEEVMQQGSDRVHRIGQLATDVYIYWLHAVGTIEDSLYEMADKKHLLALTALTGTSALTNNMTWAANIRLMLEKLPFYSAVRRTAASAAAAAAPAITFADDDVTPVSSPAVSPRRRILPASFTTIPDVARFGDSDSDLHDEDE